MLLERLEVAKRQLQCKQSSWKLFPSHMLPMGVVIPWPTGTWEIWEKTATRGSCSSCHGSRGRRSPPLMMIQCHGLVLGSIHWIRSTIIMKHFFPRFLLVEDFKRQPHSIGQKTEVPRCGNHFQFAGPIRLGVSRVISLLLILIDFGNHPQSSS